MRNVPSRTLTILSDAIIRDTLKNYKIDLPISESIR